jgi:hypothetical protein
LRGLALAVLVAWWVAAWAVIAWVAYVQFRALAHAFGF